MKSNKSISGIISIIVLIGLIYYFFGGGLETHVNNEMDKITNSVAIDAENQYNIVKKQGDPIQMYIHAGIVAAAYLQAKDEINYNKWMAIEKENEIAAGVPK